MLSGTGPRFSPYIITSPHPPLKLLQSHSGQGFPPAPPIPVNTMCRSTSFVSLLLRELQPTFFVDAHLSFFFSRISFNQFGFARVLSPPPSKNVSSPPRRTFQSLNPVSLPPRPQVLTGFLQSIAVAFFLTVPLSWLMVGDSCGVDFLLPFSWFSRQ